jgi:hypothetical protein
MSNSKSAVLWGAVGCIGFVAPSILAQEAAPPPAAEPPPPPVLTEGGAMTHDGFFLQLGVGLGYLSTSADAGLGDESLSGLSLPWSVLLGGTIGSGVVLGGGVIQDYSVSPTYTVNGEDMGEVTDLSLYLTGIGMFVDFYPDPKEGLNFQGFFGWGALEAARGGNVSSSDPTGVILSLGVGYDFWIGDEWSVGPMARFVYAPLSLNGVKYNTTAPGVLANFTYH